MTDEERKAICAQRDRQRELTGHYLPDCEPGKEPTLQGRCYHCGVEVPEDEINE